MGSSLDINRKIVVIDDLNRSAEFSLPPNSKYLVFFYKTFEEFVENQNIRNIKHIVLRQKPEEEIQTKMKAIDLQNQMVKVCPLLVVDNKSLRDKIIHYTKKVESSPNIFLYTKDKHTIKIKEHQKPYIRKVVKSLENVIEYIESSHEETRPIKMRLDRMSRDMYRKIMVKYIDKYYIEEQSKQFKMDNETIHQIQELKKSGISFQAYNSVASFEKSSLSTIVQYVVVKQDLVNEVIDSKNLNQEAYLIILLAPKDIVLSKYKQQKIWLIEDNINEIIKIVQACSSIEQTPMKSRNTIICGQDELYSKHFNQIKKIAETKLREKHKKKPKQPLIHENLVMKQEQEEEIDEADYDQMNFHYFPSNTKFSEIKKQLRCHVYSYVVVFEPGSYLENLKAQLRMNGFSNRVQLTNIPHVPGETDEEKINGKIKHLVQKIKFMIKFEFSPIKNIHCYKLRNQELNFFRENMGIIPVNIQSMNQFKKDYQGPVYRKFIESQLVVCKIQEFKNQIKGFIQQYKQQNSCLKNLKYIIIDEKSEIRLFMIDQTQYCPELYFVHYSLKQIKNQLEFYKTSVVSIPEFGKGVLSKFNKTVKLLELQKNVTQIQLKSEVISMNKVLNQVFGNKVRISSDHEIAFHVFPQSILGFQNNQNFYEQEYLTAYAKLWTIKYDIFQDKDGKFCNFEYLKEDIIFGLNRCRIYDLLIVSNEDFIKLYILKIQSCKNFIDLQIASIYILSLPHGFSYIISAVFKSPKKYQLLSKIFSKYIIVLLTTFYCLYRDAIQKAQFVCYIDDKDLEKKIFDLKPGNIVYNSTFIFSRALTQEAENVDKHILILDFENIEFLQKSRIRNNIYIQPFAFYKEGSEYIIPPETKFMVKSIRKKEDGYYKIRLTESENMEDKCFIEKILNNNNIDGDRMRNVIKQELEAEKKESIDEQYFSQKSLYKQTELINLLKSKKQLVEDYDKMISSYELFRYLKASLYFSALRVLEQKKNKIKMIEETTGITTLQMKKSEKLLDIEKSLIHFKMCEHVVALKLLKNLKYNLEKEKEIDSKWIIKTLERFIYSTEETKRLRKTVFKKEPKVKKWKISPQINANNEVEFRIKPKSHQWHVNYQQEIEMFTLSKRSGDIIQKYVQSEPENQFGTIPTSWTNLTLYKMLELTEEQERRQKMKRQQQKERQRLRKIQKQRQQQEKRREEQRKLRQEEQLNEKKRRKRQNQGPGFININGGLESIIDDPENQKRKGQNQGPGFININGGLVSIIDEIQDPEKQIVADQNSKGQGKGEQFKIEDFVHKKNRETNEQPLYGAQQLGNYEEKMEWQIFCLDNTMKVTQKKKKHFHQMRHKKKDKQLKPINL